MSDLKPKRVSRESTRREPEPAPAESAAIIGPAMAPPSETPPTPSEPAAAPLQLPQSEPIERAIDSPELAWDAFADAQAALTRGFEEFALAFTGLTQSGFAGTTDAALAMLGARTFAEIVEINAGLVRRGVDAMIEGTARLSEIGVKTVTEASRPILGRLVGV